MHASCDVDAGYQLGCGPHPPGESAARGEKPVVPLDLWRAADRITNPTRERLHRDHGPGEWVVLPSLYAQLVDAIESGAGEKVGGVQQSKPPLDSSALSLLIEIATGVRDGCLDAGIKRTRDVPADIRQIVSHVVRTVDQAVMAKTLDTLRSWAGRIRATISNDPDRTWRMHGAACRVCASTSVPVFDDDGAETRQPALIVHSEDGVIDRIECGFCASVLTGPDLTRILYDTLKRPGVADGDREAV
ncbi:MAG TPA: hypothetical protein VFW64_12150 [Pseudonocardiaceae bacterium]|nr:hypothetical protein [Pseudonocardiaceae bacterium]